MAPKQQQQTDGSANSEKSPSSSQLVDPTTTAPTSNLSSAEASSRINRQAMVTAYIAQGAIHNPSELPPVDGTWHWLEQADRIRAQALGHGTPIEVTIARSTRAIGIGLNTPNVLFIPNPAHFNPDEQPEGEGFWSYLSFADDGSSARGLARVQFGRQEAYGFEDVPYPSARQVWELRQRMMAEGRDLSVFDGIDIVWTPTESNIQGTPQPPTTSNQGIDSPTTSLPLKDDEELDKDVFDPETRLRHDPLNRDENDQTGAEDTRRYRTIMIEGKPYTNDVSSASRNKPEPHKFFITDPKGRWTKYLHADAMDWSNQKHVTKLNAWRDQRFERGDWPSKRPEKRDPYTEDQKRFIFDTVDKNNGKPPGTKQLAAIAKEFNKRFNAHRSVAAISALCARLAKMWKDNHGKYVKGPAKGQHKQGGKRKRDEGDESSDFAPSPKRGRPSAKKQEGSGGESPDHDAMGELEEDLAEQEGGGEGSLGDREEDQKMAGVVSEDDGDDDDAEMGDGEADDEQA